MEHPYLTMDRGFEAAIVEAFRGVGRARLRQRGLRSIHWCPTDRTALAEAEIEYADIPRPVYVLFRCERSGRRAREASRRPAGRGRRRLDAAANRGLMVDPAATYAIVGRTQGVSCGRGTARGRALAAGWKEHAVRARMRGAEPRWRAPEMHDRPGVRRHASESIRRCMRLRRRGLQSPGARSSPADDGPSLDAEATLAAASVLDLNGDVNAGSSYARLVQATVEPAALAARLRCLPCGDLADGPPTRTILAAFSSRWDAAEQSAPRMPRGARVLLPAAAQATAPSRASASRTPAVRRDDGVGRGRIHHQAAASPAASTASSSTPRRRRRDAFASTPAGSFAAKQQ